MQTEIKIDRSIPPPRTFRYNSWPFGKLKVGESFFAGPEIAGHAGQILRPAASQYHIRNPDWHYITRKEGDGFRLWRIAAPEASPP